MRRRTFVTIITAALAGCGSGGDGGDATEGEGRTLTPTPDSDETATPTEEPTPTETDTPTPTPEPTPAIEAGNPETFAYEGDLYQTTAARLDVTNSGQAPSSPVTAGFDWLDSDGNYLATTEVRVRTIGGGETWRAMALPVFDVEEPSQVASAETSVRGGSEAITLNPEGLSVGETQLRTSTDSAFVRTSVTNERANTVDYVAVTAKMYDAEGRLRHTPYTNKTGFAAGGTWRTKVEPLIIHQPEKVESATVVVSDNAL